MLVEACCEAFVLGPGQVIVSEVLEAALGTGKRDQLLVLSAAEVLLQVIIIGALQLVKLSPLDALVYLVV